MFEEQTIKNLNPENHTEQPNSKKWIFVVLVGGVVLLLVAIIMLIFVFINQQTDEKPPIDSVVLTASLLNPILEDYQEVRQVIQYSLLKEYENTQNEKTIIFETQETIKTEINIKNNKLENIAEAIGGFFEIGKKKDIDEAERRNSEDIQNIKKAREVLNSLKENIFLAKPLIQENTAQEFLSALNNFYSSLDVFLNQLEIYKTFNSSVLSAMPISDIIAGGEILQESIKELKTSDESNIENIHKKYINSFSRLESASIKATANLEKLETPEESVIQPLLEELLNARIAYFKLSSMQNGRAVKRAIEYGTGVFKIQFNDDQTEIKNAENRINFAINEIRSNSELSTLFALTISNDKEVRSLISKVQDKSLKISIEGAELDELVRKYERPEATIRADKLTEAIKNLEIKNLEVGKKLAETRTTEKNNSFFVKTGTNSFTIATTFYNDITYEVDVVSPSGKRYSARELANYVSESKFGNIYRIESPITGLWEIIVVAPKHDGILNFNIRVFAHPPELY